METVGVDQKVKPMVLQYDLSLTDQKQVFAKKLICVIVPNPEMIVCTYSAFVCQYD